MSQVSSGEFEFGATSVDQAVDSLEGAAKAVIRSLSLRTQSAIVKRCAIAQQTGTQRD
jgi:hypothetical protein